MFIWIRRSRLLDWARGAGGDVAHVRAGAGRDTFGGNASHGLGRQGFDRLSPFGNASTQPKTDKNVCPTGMTKGKRPKTDKNVCPTRGEVAEVSRTPVGRGRWGELVKRAGRLYT